MVFAEDRNNHYYPPQSLRPIPLELSGGDSGRGIVLFAIRLQLTLRNVTCGTTSIAGIIFAFVLILYDSEKICFLDGSRGVSRKIFFSPFFFQNCLLFYL